MSIDNLYQKKWQKFLTKIWPFRYIPFVDFVLASGSLATGNMNENSDFDVIVGVKQGRIFTARFLCWLIFGLLGWRAKHPAYKSYKSDESYKSYSNKLCFNHFVTPNAYRLSPPYNEYWKKLYKNLVPVYGDPEMIQIFFDANADWLQERRMYKSDARHVYQKKAVIKKFMEWRWFGIWADWLEKILKNIQIWKIKASGNKEAGHKPRIIVSDDELQFHPNTEREINI